ncbi:MAG TPA: NAD(P)H-dependent glycerol-3-phosphate dehydrogenase [Pyrinomonadaceae bacterium]
MKRIAVIGAGSWGTALAIMAARSGHDVVLWSRNDELVKTINSTRTNPRYLSSTIIPDHVDITNDLSAALSDARIVIFAAPSHATRYLFTAMKSALKSSSIIVSAAKGIEIDSGKRVSEVVNDVLETEVRDRFVCLSGPSFAKEVVENHPTAIVAASHNESTACEVQTDLSVNNLRIYTNSDVVGTELGGSVKNVMAIAAGMAAGLGYGSNSVAALITRGLAEITRLALTQGAQPETLMGLAGLGDLVLTCTGNLSRNRFVGNELGKGRTLAEITQNMTEIAEGIKTSRAVKRLAERAGVEMPITNEVDAVLYDGKSASEAVAELIKRPLRSETT